METIEDIKPEELKRVLSQFTGTTQYFEHKLTNGWKMNLTDGCNYVREAMNASWLFDLILSYQIHYEIRNEPIQTWKFRKISGDVDDISKIDITSTDGNNKVLLRQGIDATDFPLDHMEIWVIDNITLLPTEY
jgi:hypothetical protein